jgi:endoglucanase Acf2
MNLSRLLLAGFAALGGLAYAIAQEPVAIGKGSYAASIPPGIAKGTAESTDNRQLYLVKNDDRPIPSNKWYQNLILQKFAVGLWAYPHRVDTSEKGLAIYYPTQWKPDGSELFSDYPLLVGGKDFKPTDSRAKDWSDWLVSFRMAESESKRFDVTLGEGMPYVWIECAGITPTLEFGGQNGPGKGPAPKWSVLGKDGKAVTLPYTGNVIGLEANGRHYGVFAPEGTTFSAEGNGISAKFGVQKGQYLVVCPLPAAKDLETFETYGRAVPRNTELAWDYDAAKGNVTTKWKVVTELLDGNETKVLQGWLPHHWRESTHDFKLAGIEFVTGRGALKCAAGNEFTITYPFHGVTPNLPMAKGSTLDVKRTGEQLNAHFSKPAFARDTYAGGKDLVRALQAAAIAQQVNDPLAPSIRDAAKAELANWLTYTPGEKERFFAFYPKRKGLVGFNSSFGSEHFTDHHFHYGYFTTAAGMLGQLDPTFAADYGPMAKLVAKEYANTDRTDKRFPFLRTFDIWRGHSWADGNGFPNGNNQESTSEAVQSWVGLILLGEALGDKELTATGVMGYAMESRAIMEYWFNAHGDVFPPEWKHPIAGMIWSSSKVWGTWFTASPAWIYGIQWIPTYPAAFYMARDPKFVAKHYQTMIERYEAWEEREAAKKKGTVGKKGTPESFGGELASYILGFRMMAEPKAVTDEIDRLWNTPGDKVAHNPWMLNVDHQAHALRGLGRVDWACHANSPTAMAYVNDATKARTFVVWNPGGKERVVTFYENDKALGTATVPARTLAGFNTLQPGN